MIQVNLLRTQCWSQLRFKLTTTKLNNRQSNQAWNEFITRNESFDNYYFMEGRKILRTLKLQNNAGKRAWDDAFQALSFPLRDFLLLLAVAPRARIPSATRRGYTLTFGAEHAHCTHVSVFSGQLKRRWVIYGPGIEGVAPRVSIDIECGFVLHLFSFV